MRRTAGLLLVVASVSGLASATPRQGFAPTRPAAAIRRTTGVGDDSTGRLLFTENCQKCHGARGSPPKVIKEKFTKIPTMDAAFFAARSDDSIVTILTNGKSEVMVSWKAKLSPVEMRAVAGYIRTFAK